MKKNRNIFPLIRGLGDYAFTLVELIVSVLISAIILIFLMNYLADVFNEISYSNKKTEVLINLYEIEDKFKNLR